MRTYLRDFYDYPVVTSADEALSLLNDDFTRAAIVQTPDFAFDASKFTDVPGYNGAAQFWHDDTREKFGRRIPGEAIYVLEKDIQQYGLTSQTASPLTIQSVNEEARSAGIVIAPDALNELHEKILLTMTTFSSIVKAHTGENNFYMRCWQMWGPLEGQGRTPVLHIDRTLLTGLWYPGRATGQIYTGHVPDEVWNALNPVRENHHQENSLLQQFTQSVAPEDLMDLPQGSLIITRNSKDENLTDPATQRTVCIHKSGDIAQYGQAGFVMVPKFLS